MNDTTIDDHEKTGKAGLSNPAYHLTLVHGTFAPDAIWIEPDSEFATSLSKQLECPILDKLRWSGKNSHKARLQAGADLADKIKTNLVKYPDLTHIVIAHSHGGNVFLYALSHFETLPENLRFISMGTPYLDCERRELPYSINLITNWLKFTYKIVLPVFSLGAICLLYILFTGDKIEGPLVAQYVFMAMALGACAAIGPKLRSYFAQQLVNANELYSIFTRSYDIRSAAFTITLDEARIGLLISQHLSSFTFSVRNLFVRPYRWMLRQGPKILAGCLLVCFALGALPKALGIPAEKVYMAAMYTIIFLFMAVACLLSYLFIIAGIVSYLFRSHRFALGWESIGCMLHLHFSISKTSKTVKNCQSFEFSNATLGSKVRGLRHSWLYSDPRVIDRMAEWIKQA